MREKSVLWLIKILSGIISIIPFSLLKYLSRFLYFLIFKVLRYRNRIVRTNLYYALPYMEESKFKQVQPAFYQHLSELIIEVIKSWSISLKDLLQRITLDKASQNLIQKFTEENRHIILLLGHYGNWEWALLIIQKFTSLKAFAFYSSISNPTVDNYIKAKRERFGATMIDASKSRNFMQTLQKQASIVAVVADQSPTGRTNYFESRFLSLDTRFFIGGEKIARRLDAAVLYVHLEKVSFAKYIIHLETITDNISSLEDGVVTEQYIRRLESNIIQNPAYWLWSHKRWKGTLPY